MKSAAVGSLPGVKTLVALVGNVVPEGGASPLEAEVVERITRRPLEIAPGRVLLELQRRVGRPVHGDEPGWWQWGRHVYAVVGAPNGHWA